MKRTQDSYYMKMILIKRPMILIMRPIVISMIPIMRPNMIPMISIMIEIMILYLLLIHATFCEEINRIFS